MAPAGKEGCPCTDASPVLSSLTERQCKLPNGQPGVKLTPRSGTCVPHIYGTGSCLQHDMLHDPACDVTNLSESNIPAYCIRTWCYVDMETCIRKTPERVFRSVYFDDLYFSYSTCNSTADDWLEFERDFSLKGITIKTTVPNYLYPLLYKELDGEILTVVGDEYYDNSIPFAGVYINYINEIVSISNGGIKDIAYTHRSKASDILHPTSFTAAVQDIEDGLADMGVGPFWVTAERLKMVAFTVPIVYDKTVLVIPKPGKTNTLSSQTSKVLEPFTSGLWALVLAIIVSTAFLSVWFSKKPKLRQIGHRKRNMYARLALDEFLEKGTFFFSAGVQQDHRASLPHKLLTFGFGFFILISVSAYVANLAAFLTRSTHIYVGTIEGVIENDSTICAHPALRTEFQNRWPDANFLFNENGNDEYYRMLDNYLAGKCDVMAVGREDVSMDLELINLFCDAGLVFTDSLVLETPIAFPIRPELSPGFSYWLVVGGKEHGFSITHSKSEYNLLNDRAATCNVELSNQDAEQSDYAQIDPANMFFPIMFWVAFAFLAIILKIILLSQKRTGASTVLGRMSTFGRNAVSLRRLYSNSKNSALPGVDNPPTVPENNRVADTNELMHFDCENTSLPQQVTQVKPSLGSICESENDETDDFQENGCSNTTRKRVTFGPAKNDEKSLENYQKDVMKRRIHQLVEECFEDMKKDS